MRKFIVDTNVLFSALAKIGISRLLFVISPFEFYMPEYSIQEVRKYEKLILEKSGLTKDGFETLFYSVVDKINVVKEKEYASFIERADRIIGNIDKNDVPFVALALSFTNEGIWTDDSGFEKQSNVRVWKTSDILNLLAGD
jgi:predicted nucleic acid-binding protein